MKRPALAVIVISLAGATIAHTFHASLTEVELNAKTRRIELAMRLFTTDLERALSDGGAPLDIDTTKDVDARIERYLQAKLLLKDAHGSVVKLQMIGKESDAHTTWVYLEAPYDDAAKLTLYNGVFLELFDDQVNSVNIKREVRRGTLTFQRGDGAKAVP